MTKHTVNILIVCCFLLVALHVWGALQPSYVNWGLNLYSFFSQKWLWLAVICIVIISFPRIQSVLLRPLSALVQGISKLPALILFGGIVVIVCVAGTMFAAQLHLLGDGALLLRSLSNTVWEDNITASFNNQLLVYWIFRGALNHHLIDSPLNTYDLYIGINRVAAAIFFAGVFWCLAKAKISTLEKVLIGCILFFNAGSQFFFGYIENYVLQYVTTALFMLTGWFALERRVHIVIPLLCFGINVGLHYGNIVFVPAVLLLTLLYFRKNLVLGIFILGGLGVAGIVGTYLGGYMPAFLRHFSSGSVDFLHLFETGGGNFPYPMFSWIHLLDWINLAMLAAPLALATGIILLASFPRERFRGNPVLLFLLTGTVCGLLFTWVVNSALGLVRDWDLHIGFFIPLLILNAYLLIQSPLGERRQYILTLIAVVSIFHWVPWIGVNADEELHLRRAEMLNVPQILSPASQIFYDEALANYLFDHERYAEAKAYYEHYITLQPDNPRIIGNISDVYRKLGEKENYFGMLKRAVAMNSKDPGIYSNLGVEYASRGDTNKAIEFNLKALELDPRQDKANANLGILYASKKEFRRAQQYFDTAIGLGMRDPMLFKYAADLNYYIEDYAKAVQYYDIYLTARPSDQRARANRQQAYEELQKRPS